MVTKKDADKAYEEGKPIVTDEEYDRTFGKNATAEYLNDNSAWVKMAHLDKFGGTSLDKVSVVINGKFGFSDLKHWCRSYKQPYCCSYKYDGISVSLVYKNGFLKNAITKGAGNLGEDIVRNVRKMKNVIPSTISLSDVKTAVVKAEIIIDHETFEKHLLGVYSNPRNGAAGAARAFDGVNAKHCTLKYYGISFLNGTIYNENEKFDLLRGLGFKDVINEVAFSSDDIIKFYNDTLSNRESIGYEIDGIVVTINNYSSQEKYTTENDERPRYSMALKLPYSEKKSIIREVIWQNGLKGRITPVAIIDPVDLSGAVVSRVTLKNLDEINRLDLSIGDEVVVSRRGDVIPNIESNLNEHIPYNKLPIIHPKKCPSCKGPVIVDGPYLYCANSGCIARELGDIRAWVATVKDYFNYRGFADKRIEQLYEEGLVKNPADLYMLRYYDVFGLPGVGESVALSIMDFRHFKEIPFSYFLSGLNIEGINFKMAKLVSEEFETFDNLVNSWNEHSIHSKLNRIDGFGAFRTSALIQGLVDKQVTWSRLNKYLTIIPDKKPKGDILKGKKICITGTLSKPRDHFASLIEDNGGKVASGVSSTTDYLLAGGKVGAGKSNSAKECGTEIITEEQFIRILEI